MTKTVTIHINKNKNIKMNKKTLLRKLQNALVFMQRTNEMVSDAKNPHALRILWDNASNKANDLEYLTPVDTDDSVSEPFIDNGDYLSGENMIFYLQSIISGDMAHNITPKSDDSDEQLQAKAQRLRDCYIGGFKIEDLDALYVMPASMSTPADIRLADKDDVHDIIDSSIDIIKKNIAGVKNM